MEMHGNGMECNSGVFLARTVVEINIESTRGYGIITCHINHYVWTINATVIQDATTLLPG